MTVRIPAGTDEACTFCGASNHDRAVILWIVGDERGTSRDCDCCARSEPLAVSRRVSVRVSDPAAGVAE